MLELGELFSSKMVVDERYNFITIRLNQEEMELFNRDQEDPIESLHICFTMSDKNVTFFFNV